MKDKDKTQKHSNKELAQLRSRIAELEAAGRKRNQFEDALRLERDKAKHYLDIAEVILIALNKKGEITLINRKGNQVLGYKKRELLGKNWFTTCLPSPIRTKMKRGFLKLMTGKRKLTEFYETPALTKSGTEKTIAWHNSLLKDAQGNTIGTMSSGEDITGLKQAEETLRQKTEESESQYRATLNSMRDAIHVIDKNLRFVIFNDAFKRWNEELGLETNVIGRTVAEVFPFLPKKIGDEYRHVFKTGKPLITEENIKINGREYITETRKIPIFEGSKVTRIVTIIRNITERKRTEDETRESKQMLVKTFSSLRDALLIIDAKTLKILDCNPAASEIFKYDRNEMVGQTVNFLHVDGKTLEEFRRHLFAAIKKQGFLSRFEFKMKRKEGSIFPTEHNVTPIEDEQGDRIIWVSIVRDITEHKRAEELLRESEATLRALINAPTDSILLLNSQGVILDLNEIAAERLGKSRDELIGTLADSSLPKDVAKKRRSIISQILETGREVRFEDKRNGIWFDTVAHPITDKDGVISKIAIIARDITERKRAEEKLRESEERYRLLFEEARDGIALADADTGILLDCNQALADLVGRNRAELIGQHQAILHPPSGNNTGISATFKKHLTNKEGQVLETQVLTVTGESREVEIKANLLYLRGRKMLQGIFRDVTERKKAEEALHKSEDKYRTILKNIEEGYYEVDLAGNFTFFNDAMCRIWGYPKEELMGMNNRQYTDKESAKRLFQKFNEVYRTGRPGKGYDYEIIKKDGTRGYVETSISLQKDSSGKATGFRGIIRDITERKQAEEILRESEERFRLAFENANTGVCLVDLEGNLTKVNSKMCEIFGYAKAELEKMTINDIAHPEDMDKSPQFIQKTLRGEIDRATFEKRYIHKKGHVVTCEVSSSLVRNAEGAPLYFISHVHDITERKQAEKEIERLSFFPKLNPMPIVEFGQKDQLTYANPAAKHLFPDLDKKQDEHPFVAELKAFFPELRKKRKKYIVREVKVGDGWYSQVIVLVDPEHIRIYSADITDQKRLEEILEKERAELKLIIDSSPIIVFYKDKDGRFIRVNKLFAEALKMPEEDFVGKTVFDLYSPKIAQGMTDDDQEVLQSGRSKLNIIEQYESASGTRWARTDKIPIFDKDGSTIGLIGFAQDITERKQAEEKLRESEEKYRDLVENINDILYATDEKGIVTYVSPAIEPLSGYAPSEIIGRSFFEFLYREDVPYMMEQFQRDASGDTEPHEYRMVNKSGDVRWVRTSSRPLFRKTRFVGFRGTMTDITDRKQAEEEIKRSYEQLQETLHATVKALASTVEMKDQYTAGHQPRATKLACAIAEEMGLNPEQIEGIRMATSIHDIGKIMVPAEILNKPGPLTEIQYEMIKMHPRAGYDILKGLKLPWPVAQIILQHHERMDGSGYPQGLSGEKIMVEARILSVANVVEAMNAHRPYRPAHDIKEALAEISQNRGTFYDAAVVDACLRLFTEKGFILDSPPR